MATTPFLCRVAAVLSEAWDFIDKRDIDKHAIAWSTFAFTIYLTDWALEYVFAHPDKPGLELAAVVAAVLLPWTPVQKYVFEDYFKRNP